MLLLSLPLAHRASQLPDDVIAVEFHLILEQACGWGGADIMTLLLLMGRPELEKEKCFLTLGTPGPPHGSRFPWVPFDSSRALGWQGLGAEVREGVLVGAPEGRPGMRGN